VRLRCIGCEVLARPLYLCAARSTHIVDVELVAKGLHDTPVELRSLLQGMIDDAAGGGYDAVVLAYGLCGKATAGLVAPEIPLVKLAPNQRLIIEAYARLGTGLENAKFQPVSTVSYKYIPIVEVDEAKCTKCEECVEICPKKIFKIDGDVVTTQNTLDCSMCEICVQECEPGAITIGSKRDAFLFKVESTGALGPEEIVEKAAEILKERIRVALDFAGTL